jgi:hypothetical protein
MDWRVIPNSSPILLCVTQVIPALFANDDIIASTVRFLSVIRLSVNARNGMIAYCVFLGGVFLFFKVGAGGILN